MATQQRAGPLSETRKLSVPENDRGPRITRARQLLAEDRQPITMTPDELRKLHDSCRLAAWQQLDAGVAVPVGLVSC
jgi:hypothetical protein